LVDADGPRVYARGRLAAAGGSAGATLFEIGSITKVFTSLLLADMAERGQVKLDDPAAKYLPECVTMPARDGRQITLADLTMHVSGLPRLPSNLAPADPANPYAGYDAGKLYAFLSGYTLPRAIGEKYESSNLGAGLLGQLLARRAGKDYEALVRERILDPLGMKDTAIVLGPGLRARLAPGHDDGRPVKNWDLDALAGAGALRSTAGDILKFLAAHLELSGTPLRAAMRRVRSIEARPTGAPGQQIALGWHVNTNNGLSLYHHGGGTAGYRTFAGIDPKTRRGVVVLCNCFLNDVDATGLHLLNETAFPLNKLEPRRERTATQLDPQILAGYLGVYQLAPDFEITVTEEPGKLFAQAIAQPRFELFAETKDEFFLKAVDAQASFLRDGSGAVTSMVLHQNGRDVPGKRVSNAPPPPRTEIQVDPKILAACPAEYRLAPTFSIVVTLEEGRLFGQATAQPKFEMFAEKENAFFLNVTSARITFKRDAAGAVTGLVLHQGGRDLTGKKTK
jgi:CubicO group peptidase (beta-lactamase class C family)